MPNVRCGVRSVTLRGEVADAPTVSTANEDDRDSKEPMGARLIL